VNPDDPFQTSRAGRLFGFLFQRRSPLLGWFLFMELITTLGIIGYWIELFTNPARFHGDGWQGGACLTIVFVVSNVLLIHHRRLGIIGLILCLLLLPLLAFVK
jgi:hypothetical protein